MPTPNSSTLVRDIERTTEHTAPTKYTIATRTTQQSMTSSILALLTAAATTVLVADCRPVAEFGRHGYNNGYAGLSPYPLPVNLNVSPDIAVMEADSHRVRITCTASTSGGSAMASSIDDQPYISFYWLIAEHTSMPLNSNMPGIMILTRYRHSHFAHHPASSRRHNAFHRSRLFNYNDEMPPLGRLSNADDNADTPAQSDGTTSVESTLIIERRFYQLLHRGDNKFACRAHTFSGRRSSAYFLVRRT